LSPVAKKKAYAQKEVEKEHVRQWREEGGGALLEKVPLGTKEVPCGRGLSHLRRQCVCDHKEEKTVLTRGED